MYLIKALGPGLALCAATPLLFVLILPIVRRPGHATFLQSEAFASGVAMFFTLLVGMGMVLGMQELIAVGSDFTQALFLPPAVMLASAVLFWNILRTGRRLARQDAQAVPPAPGLAAH